jgi:hypothetical protein
VSRHSRRYRSRKRSWKAFCCDEQRFCVSTLLTGVETIFTRQVKVQVERTLSRILWKSITLSPGILQASHSRYHFFSLTGLPSKDRYWRCLSSLRGSRSPSSETLLFVSTSVCRFGTERWIDGEMFCIRLFARRRVWRRLRRGRLPRVMMALSVKSMASCWSYVPY